jgi:MYXO-CTERM domain-containing protein
VLASRIVARLAVVVLLLTVSGHAAADAPGPRPVCQAEGKGCATCWRSYGHAERDEADYASCKEAAMAKALVEACHEKQGGGDGVYFCPKGVEIPTRVVYSGCGCVVGAPSRPAAILAVAAGLLAFLLRRRR